MRTRRRLRGSRGRDEPPAQDASAERGGVLRRNRSFRRLWFGETTSRVGTAVTSVALPLVAVSVLRASAFEVGLLTAVQWFPWLVIGLPAGVWVDRLPARSIMLAADVVSMAAIGTVPLLAALGSSASGTCSWQPARSV